MFLCLLSIKGMVEPYISHSKFNVHVNNLLNRLDSIDKELLISYFIDANKENKLIVKTNTDKVYTIQNEFETSCIGFK